jgi:hypothetical protein
MEAVLYGREDLRAFLDISASSVASFDRLAASENARSKIARSRNPARPERTRVAMPIVFSDVAAATGALQDGFNPSVIGRSILARDLMVILDRRQAPPQRGGLTLPATPALDRHERHTRAIGACSSAGAAAAHRMVRYMISPSLFDVDYDVDVADHRITGHCRLSCLLLESSFPFRSRVSTLTADHDRSGLISKFPWRDDFRCSGER